MQPECFREQAVPTILSDTEFRQRLEHLDRPMALDIVATDTDADCLDRAGWAFLAEATSNNCRTGCGDDTFARKAAAGKISQDLIRCDRLPAVRWQRFDLLSPPFEDGPFHLILLRNNLLTYYQGPDRQAAFGRVMAALKPGGFLATGAHEHPPVHTDHLDRDHGCPWIYRYAASPRERYSGAGIGLRIINRGRLGVPRNVKTMTIQRRLCKVNPVPEQGHGWWPSCFSFGFSRLKDHKIFFHICHAFCSNGKDPKSQAIKTNRKGREPSVIQTDGDSPRQRIDSAAGHYPQRFKTAWRKSLW